MNRTIVVGDVHGCYDELLLLLDEAKVTDEDRVILLGDMVDRGPENGKVVDWAIDREIIQGQKACVMGNHEFQHLIYEDEIARTGRPLHMSTSHAETRKQLTKKHFDYFRTLPNFIRLPEYNAAVVHAGVAPGVPIESQSKRHLLHAQMLKVSEVGNTNVQTKWPSKVPEGEEWAFWTTLWQGPERIIFGHSVLDKPLLTDLVCGIDGGAVFGRKLHAVILPTWEIVSVDATDATKKRHLPNASKRSRQGRVAEFRVHGDVSTYSLLLL